MSPCPQTGAIVVVEHPSIRRVVRNVLERAGHEVLEFDLDHALTFAQEDAANVKLGIVTK